MKKLNEEQEFIPKVQQSEISDWENKFRQNVSSLVQFDTNNETHEKSFKLYKGVSGIEASWSGTIMLKADNYIKWNFSIQNEPFVEAKFTLNNETSQLISKLYSFYEMWKQEWEKVLTIPQSQEQNTEMATGGEPLTESKRNIRFNEIIDSSERMKRLAGIY